MLGARTKFEALGSVSEGGEAPADGASGSQGLSYEGCWVRRMWARICYDALVCIPGVATAPYMGVLNLFSGRFEAPRRRPRGAVRPFFLF